MGPEGGGGREVFAPVPYIKRVQVRYALRAAERPHGPREQLPGLVLHLQQVGRGELVEEEAQGGAVRLEQEELPPKALGEPAVLGILVVLLESAVGVRFNDRGRWVSWGDGCSSNLLFTCRVCVSQSLGVMAGEGGGGRERETNGSKGGHGARTFNSSSYSWTIFC